MCDEDSERSEESISNHVHHSLDTGNGYESAKFPINRQERLKTERPLMSTNYSGEQDEKTIAVQNIIPVDERLCVNQETFNDTHDLDNDKTQTPTDLINNHEIFLAKEKLQIKELKLADSKKRKHNIDRGTLAQVALTAVMEGDERCSSPTSCWFEGNSTCVQRRRSTSLSEAELKEIENKNISETTTNSKDSIKTSQHSLDSVVPSSSEYKSKKALGHSRSRSDGTRLIKTTKRQQSCKEVPSHAKQEAKRITESESRLSSSLPESSGNCLFV